MTRAGLLALLIVALVIWAWSALAHSWYDGECCSEQDCFQVPKGYVVWSSAGWVVGPDQELFKWGDDRLRKSLDIDFHQCLKADGSRRCLYAPDPGT